MDNNLLTLAQLASHLPTQSAGSGLLTPAQLASYATKSTPSNPTSDVGSSWDAYDKSVAAEKPQPITSSLTDKVGGLLDEATGLPTSEALKMGVDNIKSTLMPSLQSFFSGLAGVGHGLFKSVTAQNPEQVQTAGNEVASSALKVPSAVAGAVASPLSVIMNALSKIPVPTGKNIAGGEGANLGDSIHNTYIQPIANIIASNPQLQNLVTQHPNLEQDIPNFINTLLLLGGVEKTPEIKATAENTANTVANTANTVAEKAQPIIEKVGNKVNDLVNPPPAPLNEKAVLDNYNRAIKPTVSGKTSAADTTQGNARVVSGVKAIADNKNALSFTDAEGNTITGQTPKTVDQFSQAIDQTKQSIYKQYNDLAVKAGEKGITVDPSVIAKELDPVINSKSLEIANPKAVQYAKDLQARLNKTGEIDAPTAQEVIQHYNTALKAFYRNPTYDTASTASIDSMIANKFRSELDNGITGATGEQYQELKNQYGALASMEKDVTHRNIVWGRQNKVGFTANIANIASGAELVRGLMTMNPADMAVSGGIKAIQMYMKYLNNPDVGVSKIFSEIERANQPSKGSGSVSATEGIKSNSLPPDNTTTAEKVNSDVKPEPLKPLVNNDKGYVPMNEFKNELAKNNKGENPINKGEETSNNTPLIEEAKKYKSEEEFIKSQGVQVFRGQSHEGFTAFDGGTEKGRFVEGMKGTSFSTSKESAQNYGSHIIEGVVPNDSMFTAKDISLETLKAIKNTIKKLSYEDYVEGDAFENVVSRIVKLAEQQGKGAVKLTDFFPKSKIDDEIRVIDKNSFKPKSQLVDIWNQANKK